MCILLLLYIHRIWQLRQRQLPSLRDCLPGNNQTLPEPILALKKENLTRHCLSQFLPLHWEGTTALGFFLPSPMPHLGLGCVKRTNVELPEAYSAMVSWLSIPGQMYNIRHICAACFAVNKVVRSPTSDPWERIQPAWSVRFQQAPPSAPCSGRT